jgi:3-deoxy-manno-octulosonate cytidylyltransferase (CMP-KDO synthetase)
MNYLGLIPARYASTRFPGKPLVDIGGKSMIQRVYEQATKAIEWVFVATDDERIFTHVESFGGRVIMTSHDHKSGTDRCAEAVKKVQLIDDAPKFDVVINIQGDEPFIKPEQLRLLKSCFEDELVQIATLAKQISENSDIFNPNVVKTVLDKDQFAIYFSRLPIPYLRNESQDSWHTKFCYLKHLGIYAYRVQILKQITMLKPSALELAESLEQNRWIENGYKIYVQTTNLETVAIDTPEDLEKVKGLFL